MQNDTHHRENNVEFLRRATVGNRRESKVVSFQKEACTKEGGSGHPLLELMGRLRMQSELLQLSGDSPGGARMSLSAHHDLL